jgi:hypothetical protein
MGLVEAKISEVTAIRFSSATTQAIRGFSRVEKAQPATAVTITRAAAIHRFCL